MGSASNHQISASNNKRTFWSSSPFGGRWDVGWKGSTTRPWATRPWPPPSPLLRGRPWSSPQRPSGHPAPAYRCTRPPTAGDIISGSGVQCCGAGSFLIGSVFVAGSDTFSILCLLSSSRSRIFKPTLAKKTRFRNTGGVESTLWIPFWIFCEKDWGGGLSCSYRYQFNFRT